MSSTFRIVAARSGLRIGSAAVKTTGSAGLVAARAGARRSSAVIAASCRVSQLAFTRSFMSTAGDKAAAAAEEAAEPKTKKAAAKKADAKKPATKTAKAGKTATKKATTAKAKKGTAKKVKKAKKAAKPKAKKALTEEQKERRAVLELKKKISALRKAALLKDLPPTLPNRSWVLYMADHLRGHTAASSPDVNVTERMVQLSREFKALPAQEKEALRLKAAQNQEKNVAAYKKWVEKYPIATIAEANRARRLLTKLAKEGKTAPLGPARRRPIEDHRLPKRPTPLFALFTRSQWADGEAGQSVSKSGKDLSQKWKSLPEAERQKFVAERATLVADYEKELAAVLEKTSL